MSYYILPNNSNNNLSFKLTTSKTHDNLPFISHSLFNYHKQLNTKLQEIEKQIEPSNNLICNEINKNIHPYEYIYSKVPGTILSVSKLREKNNIFYDIFEIINTMNIFNDYDQSINVISFSKYKEDVTDCIEMMREKYDKDNYQCYEEINSSVIQKINGTVFDFIFYETKTDNIQSYINNLIRIILFVMHYLNNNGSAIIKIGETFDKPILELIYVLTTFFEKTYIIKPNSCNIITFEKYIICKGFISNSIHKQYCSDLFKILDEYNGKNNERIVSLFNNCDLPYYFLNKLDDLNIIIGQQQLETLNLWINILKNKNRDDKIEMQKRTNIQKCIHWCERLKIPCNKFPERLNMFLPIFNEVS
jgi:hypothetical protein